MFIFTERIYICLKCLCSVSLPMGQPPLLSVLPQVESLESFIVEVSLK
jgi:hypothetical protein